MQKLLDLSFMGSLFLFTAFAASQAVEGAVEGKPIGWSVCLTILGCISLFTWGRVVFKKR